MKVKLHFTRFISCYNWCSYTGQSWISNSFNIFRIKMMSFFFLPAELSNFVIRNPKGKKLWYKWFLFFFLFPPSTELHHFVIRKPKKKMLTLNIKRFSHGTCNKENVDTIKRSVFNKQLSLGNGLFKTICMRYFKKRNII